MPATLNMVPGQRSCPRTYGCEAPSGALHTWPRQASYRIHFYSIFYLFIFYFFLNLIFYFLYFCLLYTFLFFQFHLILSIATYILYSMMFSIASRLFNYIHIPSTFIPQKRIFSYYSTCILLSMASYFIKLLYFNCFNCISTFQLHLYS